jgi:hypothetical protein
LQAQFAAQRTQQIHIALGTLAKGEIAARHHAVCAEALDQDGADEILGARSGKVGVEVEHQHRGRACGEIKLLPLFERRQLEGRHIGAEEAHRMRIEGGDDRGAALGLRPADRLPCDRLMPAVEPVEIAERDDRAAQAVRHGCSRIEPRNGHDARFCSGWAKDIGTIPARIRRRALPPITARISSAVKPSSSSAWVTWTS